MKRSPAPLHHQKEKYSYNQCDVLSWGLRHCHCDEEPNFPSGGFPQKSTNFILSRSNRFSDFSFLKRPYIPIIYLPIHRFMHSKSHCQATLKSTLPFLWSSCLLLLLASLFAARRQNSANDDARPSPPPSLHHQPKQTHTRNVGRSKAHLIAVSSPRSGPPPEARVRKDTQ